MQTDAKGVSFTPAQRAILTTVLYSDIFSFPLIKEEIWKFLISKEKITWQEFEKGLHVLISKKRLVSQKGYYCLANREKIITYRIANLNKLTKKLQRAWFVTQKLAYIPSIFFIGITGGLAVGSARENDDIDLVIITKKNTLFTTRLFVLFILQLLGVRRSRTQKTTANMICANLLFDESVLDWPRDKQDVYTAREIAQIVPLFERERMYKRFITANEWVKEYLPNSDFQKVPTKKIKKSLCARILHIIFNPFFEWIFCSLQMSWIKRHQTRETVTKHLLAFHPNDYRFKIMRQLRLKTRQFGLLTKF